MWSLRKLTSNFPYDHNVVLGLGGSSPLALVGGPLEKIVIFWENMQGFIS
jgi:hypothetical protein